MPVPARSVLGIGFLAMAAWTLIPDKIDEDTEGGGKLKPGLLGTTTALAARFHNPIAVVAGTTLGMMIASVPAVFIGDRLAGKMPVRLMHGIAAVIFAVIGV